MTAWDRYTATPRLQNERRRALVLRHPEVARRLTRPPLDYARPEQWTGYIPPESWNGEHNDSPRRAALLDIIAAAEAVERTPDDVDVEVF